MIELQRLRTMVLAEMTTPDWEQTMAGGELITVRAAAMPVGAALTTHQQERTA